MQTRERYSKHIEPIKKYKKPPTDQHENDKLANTKARNIQESILKEAIPRIMDAVKRQSITFIIR